MGESPRSGSQAIERALEVLDCFAGGRQLSLSGIVARTGLPASTAHRIMAALVSRAYLERGTGDLYRVGAHLAELLPRQPMAEDVAPQLYSLSARIRIAASFGVREGAWVVTRLCARPPVRHCPAQLPAEREPLHATAMGKALLAFGVESPSHAAHRLGSRLEAFTASTRTSPRALAGDLQEARRRGFALSDEERTAGVREVAVPVFGPGGPGGPAFGAIGVQASSRRMTDRLVASLVPALHHFAAEIGGRLSDRPGLAEEG